ncbi:hypothetical protein AQUCO_00800001v1 [Aquilegia coerulea]|uniref:DUF4408 domain-containing protein n=1 Tax=Aquilegia coerulea TaxID=218851 RepID=A0A2G5EGV1_AQUCA|nr:hypothetical protein AQUCO_00800001v1 [Aquilegia coerulea]
MAITSRSSSNWILSLKVFLASSLVFTIAVILKLSVPVILQFIVSELPLLWRSVISWLKPPYLYVVINGIIITIAASSRFHQNKVDEQHHSAESIEVAQLKVPLPVVNSVLDFSVSSGYDSLIVKSPVEINSEFVMKHRPDVRSDYEIMESKMYKEEQEEKESKVITKPVSEKEEEEEGFVISRSSWTPSGNDLTEIQKENIFPIEKPPVSIRFSHHRKTLKSSAEAGKALGVAKPKRHDTLESTWKTITDGRPIPLARHLKKSDTWETHGRHNHSAGPQEQTPPTKIMKKCETFHDRNKNPASPLSASPGSGKLKKEPSLSHDELNRRVEAFIKKFNEDMRLQRQESLNQYKEMMVNRR